MAAVTRTEDDGEQLRLLRGYLATLHHTDAALRRWVDDTKLVLDRLVERAGRGAGRPARRAPRHHAVSVCSAIRWAA